MFGSQSCPAPSLWCSQPRLPTPSTQQSEDNESLCQCYKFWFRFMVYVSMIHKKNWFSFFIIYNSRPVWVNIFSTLTDWLADWQVRRENILMKNNNSHINPSLSTSRFYLSPSLLWVLSSQSYLGCRTSLRYGNYTISTLLRHLSLLRLTLLNSEHSLRLSKSK